MTECGYKLKPRGMTGGWEAVGDKPVLGGELGTCFDCYVMKENEIYKIWFSWRPTRCIAYAESKDGIVWDNPRVVLTATTGSSWEGHEVNRPTVVKKDGMYHMWYTGQMFAKEINPARSCIGYAISRDGIHWEKRDEPVLVPEQDWEGISVMCPHVLWEEELQCFRMWYSGGRMHEADAIGIAVSVDGIHWKKDTDNPIFTPNPEKYWEMGKVEACFVCPKKDGWYYMFYLGMDGDLTACMGLARSRNGKSGWERHPSNPIIAGFDGSWDWQGICKASVLETEDGYMLWYNGCNRRFEEIGLARHKGFDLGFPKEGETGMNERGLDNGLGKVNYYVRDCIARY